MTFCSLRCRISALAATGVGAASLPLPYHNVELSDSKGRGSTSAAQRIWWLPLVAKTTRCDTDDAGLKGSVTRTTRTQSINRQTQKMAELEKGVDFKAIMSQCEFFGDMKSDVFAIAERVGRKIWYKKGTVILEQNDVNDTLFLVGLGKLSVAIDKHPVGELKKGDCFGESAIIMKRKATATIKVVSEQALLFAMSHDDLCDELPPEAWEKLSELANMRDMQNVSYTFLKESPIFVEASNEFLQACVKSLKFVTFESGTPILTMGVADKQGMYFIRAGELGIFDAQGQVATLKENDCVGEAMLFAGPAMKRSCTARALTFVEAYQLSKKDFTILATKYPKDFEEMKNVSKARTRQNLSRATRVRAA